MGISSRGYRCKFHGFSPVIGSDGTIYVGSPTGLYAFEGTSQGLASSAWPRFQHDNKNTGRIGGQ